MESFVVILILSVSFCAADINNCPVHIPRTAFLYQFGTSCYQFNMGLKTLKKWGVSGIDCKVNHGDLIDIHSEAEQDFIISAWKNLSYTIFGSSRLWIGLNDIFTPGIWTWFSGRKEIDFQNWASGRPDNESGKHCAVMTLSGQWEDYDCYDSYNWICEFSTIPNYDCPANLPRTYKLLSWRDHCYLFNPNYIEDWYNADISCLTIRGGYLVDIHSQEEQDFINYSWSILRIKAHEDIGLWIGLTDGQNYFEEGRWNWTSSNIDYIIISD
ncbi:C-type mannose receptor 2-like [Mercenaria mercenaria]|uniref:C-type mannose receptor 2-like n=1 Tax=Mercenaria mercenaria TaxID=6596 RepID=UPI00234ECE9E|nr:C-type mannose receptor 2-like [Mercenaria mercenaria]